jgi:predicted 2-oxoglutarate/Fe(II)-dependent dioxygenase YbiX/peroxiredoxin
MTQRPLSIGDPAPWFTAPTRTNETYHLDTAGGIYIVLSFFGSGAQPYAQTLLREVMGPWKPYFDGRKYVFYGVSADAEDETGNCLPHALPGIRHFFDRQGAVSTLYGALPAPGPRERRYRPFTVILDPMMKILAIVPMDDIDQHQARLGELLRTLPALDDHAGVPLSAPVLIVPRVFEPEFCRELIGLYQASGGRESGFMRQQGDTTVGILDSSFKKRRDFVFEQEEEYAPLRAAIRTRLVTRLIPEIYKAFQYHVTHIERYIVACYDGQEGGFFRRHRDNTTTATAHRRFACTLNLNTDEYEGGELMFPEFGTGRYRAPTGGAVIFSCSLLHEALPVTRGLRYAFLPFLYDEEAARLRRENSSAIRDETGFDTATPQLPPA